MVPPIFFSLVGDQKAREYYSLLWLLVKPLINLALLGATWKNSSDWVRLPAIQLHPATRGFAEFQGIYCTGMGHSCWVWVKIRYPNNWMVDTQLD